MTRPALQLCPWLQSALGQLERAAAAGRLGHGWLISGPRGIGKLNLACVLAERILFDRVGSATPEPATPQRVLADYAESAAVAELHPDLHLIAAEEGKQSIAVEQIRGMIADLSLTALAGAYKVVIIERADRMTNEAANALLKSLEEPTPNTYLLLLAERPGRLPATIRSRCQLLPLRLPAPDLARQWLGGGEGEVTNRPPGMIRMAPIAMAGLLENTESISNYNKLYDSIEELSKGKADPHAIAEEWQRQDPELALGALIDCLRSTIRHVLVPGHTTRITDEAGLIMDNSLRNSSIGALFARLRMAENLREQIGRGTNIELALKALLLGLDVIDDKRLEV